jgi:hypothetical protein
MQSSHEYAADAVKVAKDLLESGQYHPTMKVAVVEIISVVEVAKPPIVDRPLRDGDLPD